MDPSSIAVSRPLRFPLIVTNFLLLCRLGLTKNQHFFFLLLSVFSGTLHHADYDEVTGADIPTTWYPDGVLSHDGSEYGVADATKKATWDKFYADAVTYGDKLEAGTATDDDIPVLGS